MKFVVQKIHSDEWLPDLIDGVFLKGGVSTDDGEVFGFCGGDEESIERIAVIPREF